MALGESVLDDALEGLGPCRSNMSLILNLLLSSGDGGIIDIFLEGYAWIVAVVEKLCLDGFIVS